MLEKIKISELAKKKLAKKIELMPKVFSFSDYPTMAAICSCLGIAYELGSSEMDRLSPYLGFDIGGSKENPWEIDFVRSEGEMGIQFSRKDRKPIVPRSPELALVLDPCSFDKDGVLSKAVIFPNQVAKKMKTRGFELVIVRDWILRSALESSRGENLNYLKANLWELESNIALTQLSLSANKQLPFFGTHDIVDHVFHASIDEYNQNSDLVVATKKVFKEEFHPKFKDDHAKLTIAYLGAVILDDLAQPAWYSSKAHRTVLGWVNKNLPKMKIQHKKTNINTVPSVFHEIVELLRSRSFPVEKMQTAFQKLCFELCWVPQN